MVLVTYLVFGTIVGVVLIALFRFLTLVGPPQRRPRQKRKKRKKVEGGKGDKVESTESSTSDAAAEKEAVVRLVLQNGKKDRAMPRAAAGLTAATGTTKDGVVTTRKGMSSKEVESTSPGKIGVGSVADAEFARVYGEYATNKDAAVPSRSKKSTVQKKGAGSEVVLAESIDVTEEARDGWMRVQARHPPGRLRPEAVVQPASPPPEFPEAVLQADFPVDTVAQVVHSDDFLAGGSESAAIEAVELVPLGSSNGGWTSVPKRRSGRH